MAFINRKTLLGKDLYPGGSRRIGMTSSFPADAFPLESGRTAIGVCAGAAPRARREVSLSGDEVFDLIAIGCGPAGEKGGAQAAYFGKRVAVLERGAQVGGSCVNTGTVPSKTLRESALYFSGLEQRGLYGIDYSLKENLTVQDFMHHEHAVVELERQQILKNLELHHIELIFGQASFEDEHTVAISGA